MSLSTPFPPFQEDQSRSPLVSITYECVLLERLRESATYLYELACSISYPVTSGHLSMRVTGQHTYRNAAAREIPFTRHATGVTAYVELLEAERLEVRIVEQGGIYCKAFYAAHGQELTELYTRHVISTIHCLDIQPEIGRQKEEK